MCLNIKLVELYVVPVTPDAVFKFSESELDPAPGQVARTTDSHDDTGKAQ
jgi:hypothetical protein